MSDVFAEANQVEQPFTKQDVVKAVADTFYDSAIQFESTVIGGLDGRLVILSALMTSVTWLISDLNDPVCRDDLIVRIVQSLPEAVTLELEHRTDIAQKDATLN